MNANILQWNLQTGNIEKTLTGHTGSVYCLIMSKDETKMWSGSRDLSILEWDMTPEVVSRYLTGQGHSGPVACIQVSNDGTKLWSGSRDTKIIEWNLTNNKIVKILQGHESPITCMKLSKDETKLWSGS